MMLLPASLVAQKSEVWTNSRELQPEVTTNQDYRAWNSFKYLIKDGMFYTKDIKTLKAKLAHWNYWFYPHPFKNRFEDIMLEEFQKQQNLIYELEFIEKRHNKYKKRMRILVAVSATTAFTLGLFFSR